MNPIEQELKEKYSEIKFELYPNDKTKQIYLTGFIVPITLRSSGIGSQFMEDLIRLSDEYGYKITLSPSSSYGGNVNRLKNFYQRFGFVFNKGNNRDFSHKQDMYREPKSGINEEGSSETSSSTTVDRVKRGKANPISNKGQYDFGTQRGKANPILNTGEYDFGTQRGVANPINEQILRMRKILGLTEVTIPKSVQQKVGNVLFGSNPKIASIQNKKPEDNTPLETNILKSLKNWTHTSTDQSASKVISTVSDLLTLKKYFPEVLNPPYGELAYRGESIALPVLFNWLKQNTDHENLGDGTLIRFKTLYPYKPYRDVTSWSTSLFYATGFTGKANDAAINVPVIFQTKIDDTFIMNPKVMNIIYKSSINGDDETIKDEDEVIKINGNGEYYLIMYSEDYEMFLGSNNTQ
jgi:hypothetical protein